MHDCEALTALLGSDPVDRVVRVSLSPDTTTDSDSGGRALDSLAISVDIGNLELDRGVVLGGDKTVYK